MRILSWSLGEILGEVKTMEKEQRALKQDITKLCWYMRGGVSLDDAFAMSFDDRQIISEIIKENLETTKRSGLPFF